MNNTSAPTHVHSLYSVHSKPQCIGASWQQTPSCWNY